MSDLSGAFRLRSVTPATVEVDFGAGPQQMTVLNLMGRVPTGGPVDFTALDAFPQSGNILWSGADRGLGEALRTRPRIRFLLEELRLDFDDPPGTLDDPHMLAACSRLRTISLGHAYALGPDDLPDLPELCRLELHGIRRSVARALRDRYRGSGVQVYVQGDVSDAWPARHLDNPFREWAEDSEGPPRRPVPPTRGRSRPPRGSRRRRRTVSGGPSAPCAASSPTSTAWTSGTA